MTKLKAIIPIIIFFLAVSPAYGAISFDRITTAQDNFGSSLSFSHACSTTSTLLIVNVNGSGQTVSAITYGGNALTLATSQGGSRSAIYYLSNPPTGSNTVQINFGGEDALSAAAMSFQGTATSSVIGATDGNTDSTGDTTNSQSITPLYQNSWIISNIQTSSDGGNHIASGTNQTERYDLSVTGSGQAGSTATTTYGTVTMTWDWQTDINQEYHAVAEIKEPNAILAPVAATGNFMEVIWWKYLLY